MIKRWLITFAVAWLLGCVVTVLVAWCCTVRGPHAGQWELEDNRSWPSPPPEGWATVPSMRLRWINREGMFRGISFTSAIGATNDQRTFQRMEIAHAGWPLPAMRSRICRIERKDDYHRLIERTPVIHTGIALPPHRMRTSWSFNPHFPCFGSHYHLRLPLEPIWYGFMLNTALSAGLITLLAWCFRAGTPNSLDSRQRRVSGTLRLLSVLILGAGLSVAVALAMLGRWQLQTPPQPLDVDATSFRVSGLPIDADPEVDSLEWPEAPPSHWPPGPSHLFHHGTWSGITFAGYIRSSEDPAADGLEDNGPARFTANIYQAGWPMRCVEGIDFVENAGGTRIQTFGTFTIGLPFHSSASPPGVRESIPLGPIWLGLLANTFFYAYLIALPVLSIRAVRVVRRRRRGACESCGYSRAGLAPEAACPECGAVASITVSS